MGPAIRHAATKLGAVAGPHQAAHRRVRRLPAGQGLRADRAATTSYGLHDTARALQEAERARIATFCVTVDPAGHDYLRTMCAEDRYLVIDDVRALPARADEALPRPHRRPRPAPAPRSLPSGLRPVRRSRSHSAAVAGYAVTRATVPSASTLASIRRSRGVGERAVRPHVEARMLQPRPRPGARTRQVGDQSSS